MSKATNSAPEPLFARMLGSRVGGSSKQIDNCGLALERPSPTQTKSAISEYADNLAVRYEICSSALSILAEIVAAGILERPPRSTLMRVGQVILEGVRITAWILGSTRIDGGLVLIRQSKGSHSSHEIYVLDDLYRAMELNHCREGYTSELWELVIKAVARRNQILKGTTNYFSGISGKVINIL
jgi:hypothetical protein